MLHEATGIGISHEYSGHEGVRRAAVFLQSVFPFYHHDLGGIAQLFACIVLLLDPNLWTEWQIKTTPSI